MKVGDLLRRRNNEDLALILSIQELSQFHRRLEVMRIGCGNIQHVWDYEYEVLDENR